VGGETLEKKIRLKLGLGGGGCWAPEGGIANKRFGRRKKIFGQRGGKMRDGRATSNNGTD